ncbi:Stc1 domain-containing protein [Phialemonium atrogriseum]|uniref:Stc1 domain-containing protein n=1 Tax=Phialemonium atrogriseum TaxID=1093897 RepID=A0AAJ0CC45_9PEZI|nr:Stc1 domain-containing protein [Phialemonium atrogriseum]KAK1772552.1 Stc1 domain-containing protein [Phialemonium atrogriseum]
MGPGGSNLPAKIRCDLGGEWKDPSQYSKKQLQIYMTSVRTRKNVTPAKSGIICRVHKGEPGTQELRCQGPCNAWKPLLHFSKNSRTTGRNWCTACISWSEANVPGCTPYVAPLAKRSPEEDEKHPVVPHGLDDDMLFDYDGQDGKSALDPSESDGPRTMNSKFFEQDDHDAEDFDGPAANLDNGQDYSLATDEMGRLHLGGEQQSKLGGSTQHQGGDVFPSASAGPGRGPMAPHWNIPKSGDGPLGSLGSSADPTTVMMYTHQQAARQFNAYSPGGERRPTAATGRAAVGNSGWAKPKMRKTKIEPPDYLRHEEYRPCGLS